MLAGVTIDSATPSRNRSPMSCVSVLPSAVAAETRLQAKNAMAYGILHAVAVDHPAGRNLQKSVGPEERRVQRAALGIGQAEQAA